MTEIAAPVAAPSAPNGAPQSIPRGHEPAAPQRSVPRGWEPVDAPASARTDVTRRQVVETPKTPERRSVEPQTPAQARATGQAPAAKSGETQAQREARLEKMRAVDGTEVEVDVADLLARHEAGLKRKVKVNGTEREMTLEELEKKAQLAEAAWEKFEQGTAAKKAAEERAEKIERLGEMLRDPSKAPDILRRIMGDEGMRAMSEAELRRVIDADKLTPQERAFRQQQQERESQFEARARELEQREQAIRQEQARFEAQRQPILMAQLGQQFSSALRAGGVEPTARAVEMFANYKQHALEHGSPFTDADIAQRVGDELEGSGSRHFQKLPVARLAERLGPDVVRALVEHSQASLADQPGRPQAMRQASPQPRRERPPMQMPEHLETPEEQRRWLRDQDMARERRSRR